jgi:exosortase/archaeosortase family protein
MNSSTQLRLGFLALACFHLVSCLTILGFNAFSNAVLLWIFVGILIQPKLEDGNVSNPRNWPAIGCSLLSWTLLLGSHIIFNTPEVFLHLFPFLSVLGAVLLLFGFRGIKMFSNELLLLSLFWLSLRTLKDWLAIAGGLQSLTAHFSTMLLQFLGFNFYPDGIFICSNQPKSCLIEVTPQCSAVGAMLRVSAIAIFFQALDANARLKKLILPLLAIILSFLHNGSRVAILAWLGPKSPLFEPMHQGSSAMIYEALLLLLPFVGICTYYHCRSIRSLNQAKPHESAKSISRNRR